MATSSLERAAPIYITQMEEVNTAEAAFAVFQKQDKVYGSSPYFYLASLNHFYEKRGNNTYSQTIES